MGRGNCPRHLHTGRILESDGHPGVHLGLAGTETGAGLERDPEGLGGGDASANHRHTEIHRHLERHMVRLAYIHHSHESRLKTRSV